MNDIFHTKPQRNEEGELTTKFFGSIGYARDKDSRIYVDIDADTEHIGGIDGVCRLLNGETS